MSYYCSKCRTNWPASDEYKSCPACKQWTFHDASTESDVDLVEHAAVGTQTTDATIAHAWRCERYREMGFSEENAAILASARGHKLVSDRGGTPRLWSFPLDWQRVARALAAGCSHELALRVFS